ncbi:MAG: NUDIX hydrolase [Chloroflexota bacterium]
MTQPQFKHRVARLLRRAPWLIAVPYYFTRVIHARYSLGAVGVIINADDKVLLVEHAFHPKTPWGLPGGWVGRRENPARTVARELQEELSIQADVGPVVLVDRPYANHLDIAYLCTSTDPISQLSYELLSHDWFDRDALPRLLEFHYHAIQHAFHIRHALAQSGR